MKKCSCLLLIISCLLCCFSGCQEEKEPMEKLKDLEFTVVEEEDVPKELIDIITQKKRDPFKVSYSDGEYLYVVVGYGVQNTGGYSISVDEFYETENALLIHTTLLGPEKKENITTAVTYPYVVVKTEFIEKNVVFQ